MNNGVNDQFSPCLLHIQHQFSIIIFFFLKLSIVKILPNVAVYKKIATLAGLEGFQMLFQGKSTSPLELRLCSKIWPQTLFVHMASNKVYVLHLPISNSEYIKSKKDEMDFNSQSCIVCIKFKTQWTHPLQFCKWFATKLSLSRSLKVDGGTDFRPGKYRGLYYSVL